MGFCRRCGDIVVGARCKCGGFAVAPVVKWNQGDQEENQDKWSRTYVTKDKQPNPTETQPVAKGPLRPSITGNGPSNRFPKPQSHPEPATTTHLGSKVSAHIATVTSQRPSVLKHSLGASEDLNAEEGILPNPDGSELSKVYGSVLQSKESLSSFTCAICGTVFPPDATLFPDPSSFGKGEGQKFLCRPCFVVNGGSKGDCPSCGRPVLTLKSEGGFVEASGKVWHRRCFRCDGCDKELGDNPMVDLLGRPSCDSCFDTCLKRPSRATPTTPTAREKRDDSRRNTPGPDGSPTLEELELRLGIIRSREGTPAVDRGGRFNGRIGTPYSVDTSPTIDRRMRTLSMNSTSSPSGVFRDSSPSARLFSRHKSPEPETSLSNGSPSSGRRSFARLKSPEPEISTPSPRRSYGSPAVSSPSVAPTEDAVEEMKRRFLNQASPSPSRSKVSIPNTTTPTRRSLSRPRESISSTPVGDYLDSGSISTPQRNSKAPASTRVSPSPALRSSASTSSLRSAMKSQTTHVQPEYTGESSYPLLRQQRTGTTDFPLRSEFTGETDYLPRQRTGNTTYLPRAIPGETVRSVDRQRTGESLGTQHTGYGIFPQATGEVTLPLRSQKTGETMYEVRTHRTGEFQLKSHITGEELRFQRTGNTKYDEERTGVEEVESLVGTYPSSEVDDLIDLRSTVSSGSMSKIPVPTKPSSSARYSSTGLGLTTSLGLYDRSMPSTPDLALDMSDTMSTRSSGPSTPPSVSPPLRKSRDSLTKDLKDSTPTQALKKVAGIDLTIPRQLPSNSRCAKCALPLFNTKFGGKFVTVPEAPTSMGVPPKTYHTACFKCNVCGEVFEEKEGGHAVFVRGEEGACHVRCAPPEKITLRRIPEPTIITPAGQQTSPKPSPSTTRMRSQTTTSYPSSSRYDPPAISSAAPIFPSSRKFGTSSSCPGCNQAVSQMERGVVPGPQGSRWHATCLVCGGKETRGKRKEDGKAGCGKKLDSAAKTDAFGNVWCRECLLLLPVAQRQASPVRSPVLPTATGNRSSSNVVAPQITGGSKPIAPQFTNGTTIARQFTGLGGPDPALLRQLTGGGLSPTRQLSSSPTKMHDGPRPGAGRYPRPKSVTGVRSTTGEGRGMFLVRQLTGGNSSFSGNDYGL
ncbi:hypothetical protein BXZ70DRAFT_938061 [Cristinia sonorae]|uniref:LIM zinc-binding domain-containing protein n=1 Tax=Cristinia sonorae TaxID=1940300 RepID=A0A8K0UPV9_9AGAR|nr:hypothetical protein BXZ70DRAFT_938061 [Cristinia sonorae]